MEAEIRSVVALLTPDDQEYIRDLSEDQLIRLHRTLGMYLRNAFRANRYPALFQYCSSQETPATRCFDSISATALRLIWEHLRRSGDAS